MAHPRIAYGYNLHIWTVTESTEQAVTAEKGLISSLEVGHGADNL